MASPTAGFRNIVVGVAAALLAAGGPVWAQGYPDRPIRLMVGFPPGGSSDTVSRLISQYLSPRLGQPVVVENKPGAGGVIASDLVAKAPADGHTLLFATAANATSAAIMKKLPFDALKDFAWISTVTTYPFTYSTRADAPFNSLPELIAHAKANPGKVTYSSAGVGSSHHLLGEWFAAQAAIEIVHVPFKGGTSPVTETVAGRVDIMVETMTLALPHIKGGRLKALAVTSPDEVGFLPGVAAATRALPGLVFQSWLGLAAPAATPPAIIARLNAELRQVLAEPDVKKRLADLGGAAAPVTPETMRAQVESEIARWQKLVDARNIERQ